MPKARKKKESNRPFVVGFAVTVIVLLSVTAGFLYFRSSVSVENLPSSIPQYTPLWGKYIPQSFLLFGFENYTAIRHYNSSYPTQYSTLLNIIDLHVVLKAPAIESALSVSFASPNESIAFAFVNPGAFSNFTNAFAAAAPEAVPVGQSTMYFVRDLANGQVQFGWLALIPQDRGIAFAIGGNDAKTALQKCLEVTPSDSFVSDLNVRKMLYITNGSLGHLAIGVQAFPGVLPTANRTLTVVDVSGNHVIVRRVLEFNSTATALSEYNATRQSYLSSSQFAVYDSFVRATEFQAISDVVGAVRLVE